MEIPNSVTKIGERAFYGCGSLASVTIGNSVTSIGRDSFSRCISLKNVYCYAETVPSMKSCVFEDSRLDFTTLHVPEASVDFYKSADQWKDFGTIIALSEAETHINSPQMTDGESKTKKILESGRIVIISSGKRYGVDGTEIK